MKMFLTIRSIGSSVMLMNKHNAQFWGYLNGAVFEKLFEIKLQHITKGLLSPHAELVFAYLVWVKLETEPVDWVCFRSQVLLHFNLVCKSLLESIKLKNKFDLISLWHCIWFKCKSECLLVTWKWAPNFVSITTDCKSWLLTQTCRYFLAHVSELQGHWLGLID